MSHLYMYNKIICNNIIRMQYNTIAKLYIIGLFTTPICFTYINEIHEILKLMAAVPT